MKNPQEQWLKESNFGKNGSNGERDFWHPWTIFPISNSFKHALPLRGRAREIHRCLNTLNKSSLISPPRLTTPRCEKDALRHFICNPSRDDWMPFSLRFLIPISSQLAYFSSHPPSVDFLELRVAVSPSPSSHDGFLGHLTGLEFLSRVWINWAIAVYCKLTC